MVVSTPWRWTNVPVPEAHVVGVALALGLRIVWPAPARCDWAPRRATGQALCVAGLGIVARSVVAAGQVEVGHPAQLVTHGPYAASRNPMYLGWALLHLGVGVATGSAWTLMTLPAASLWIHREVRHEERALSEIFGATYAAYQAQVPRYLPNRLRPVHLQGTLRNGSEEHEA